MLVRHDTHCTHLSSFSTRHLGRDITDAFEALYHSPRARNIAAGLIVGKLKESTSNFLTPQSIRFREMMKQPGSMPGKGGYGLINTTSLPREFKFNRPQKKEMTMMDPVAYRKFELIEVEQVSHDTNIFRFSNGNSKLKPNIPIGKHIVVGFTKDEKFVKKEYTPIGEGDDYFELLVKKYDTGGASAYLHSLNIGDKVSMKGYFGNFVMPTKVKYLILFAAGTGIAPMVSILKSIKDDTNVLLIYSNKTEDDILLESTLNTCINSINLKVEHLLSRPKSDLYTPQKGDQSIIDGILTKYFGDALPLINLESDVYYLVCGPDNYCNAIKEILEKSWKMKDNKHFF